MSFGKGKKEGNKAGQSHNMAFVREIANLSVTFIVESLRGC